MSRFLWFSVFGRRKNILIKTVDYRARARGHEKQQATALHHYDDGRKTFKCVQEQWSHLPLVRHNHLVVRRSS